MSHSELPSGYIVDTNVISNRTDGNNRNVSEWMRRYTGLVHMSAISVAEMRRGLVLLEQRINKITDRKVKTREHTRFDFKMAWYKEVTSTFGDRIVPIDAEVADKWAEISVKFPSLKGGDKVIAATALVKRYGVATENLGHFRASGVPLMNPFDPDTWTDDYDDDPIRRLS